MTQHSIAELANTWRPRYLGASRKEKTKILNEFVAITGYHRKAATGYSGTEGSPRCWTSEDGPESTHPT